MQKAKHRKWKEIKKETKKKQTNKQTNNQTTKQPNNQTTKQPKNQTNNQPNNQTNKVNRNRKSQKCLVWKKGPKARGTNGGTRRKGKAETQAMHASKSKQKKQTGKSKKQNRKAKGRKKWVQKAKNRSDLTEGNKTQRSKKCYTMPQHWDSWLRLNPVIQSFSRATGRTPPEPKQTAEKSWNVGLLEGSLQQPCGIPCVGPAQTLVLHMRKHLPIFRDCKEPSLILLSTMFVGYKAGAAGSKS